jgi:hypothetical protein
MGILLSLILVSVLLLPVSMDANPSVVPRPRLAPRVEFSADTFGNSIDTSDSRLTKFAAWTDPFGSNIGHL